MTTLCQQDEVYTAELVLPTERFSSIEEAQGYLASILDEAWWLERFSRVRGVDLCSRRKGKWAGVSTWYEDTWRGHIELASDGLDKTTLIHELAHVCATAEYGSRAHDPAFVGTFLELTFRLLGTEAWTALRTSMLENGVTW